MGHPHLIFDLHGTLISKKDIPISEYEKICLEIISEKHGCDKSEARKKYDNCLARGFSHSQTMKDLGVYDRYIEIFNGADKNNGLVIHKENPELASILYRLSEQKKLYVLTNNPRNYAIKIIEALGVNPGIFTKIVALEDVANPKPSTDGFKLIVNGGPKTDYVYFGDREDADMAPAREFGIDAVLVNEDILEKLEDEAS